MTVLSLGVVRGLAAQIVGTGLGMGLVVLVRVLMGLHAWEAEPATVVGAMLGTILFMIGVGSMNDWFRWTKGEDTPIHHGAAEDKPSWTRYFGVDYSHKVIGIQYGVLAIILLLVGGSIAGIFRVELAEAGRQFLDPAIFNTMIGMHGWGMIISILLGIAAFSNYLVPLLIGASDMAFPRLNAWAFWIMIICNSVVPLLFLFKRFRTSIFWLFTVSILVNVGMWFERFVIIVTSLAHDFLPYAWGNYRPSPVELMILVGSFAWFFLLFLLFSKHLPSISMTEVKELLPPPEEEKAK